MGNIWVISDTHFGIKNNSKSWETLFSKWCSYIEGVFTSRVSEGDVLVHLGDVFDDRQTIGLSSMNLAVSFFERMSEIFSGVYVLCGNHDAYNNSSNEITSLECIKHIPGVRVIKECLDAEVCGRKVSFIPWIESVGDVRRKMEDAFASDIVFCHADFGGCTMNASGTKSESKLGVPDVSRIYAGHIHHSQRYGRVTYVGSPYHTSQNDRGNPKGVWRIDTLSMKDEFVENCFSPMFERFDYQKIEDMTFGEFKKMCRNKFVEVCVDGDLLSRVFFKKILACIKDEDDIRDITFVPNRLKRKEHPESVSLNECVSIEDMLDKYINEVLVCGPDIKENVRKISKRLINGKK